MTPEQIRLARHALGLPNKRRQSYRNRYFVSAGAPARAEWTALVVARLATAEPCDRDGMDLFKLTAAGAIAALEAGERLDREDFAAMPLGAVA